MPSDGERRNILNAMLSVSKSQRLQSVVVILVGNFQEMCACYVRVAEGSANPKRSVQVCGCPQCAAVMAAVLMDTDALFVHHEWQREREGGDRRASAMGIRFEGS